MTILLYIPPPTPVTKTTYRTDEYKNVKKRYSLYSPIRMTASRYTSEAPAFCGYFSHIYHFRKYVRVNDIDDLIRNAKSSYTQRTFKKGRRSRHSVFLWKKKKNGVTLTKTKFLVYARVFCIQKKKTQVYKRGKKWHIYLDAGEYIIDKKKKYALFSVFIDLLYERNTYKLRPGLTLVYNNNILRFHSRPRTRVYIYIYDRMTRVSRVGIVKGGMVCRHDFKLNVIQNSLSNLIPTVLIVHRTGIVTTVFPTPRLQRVL